MRHCHGPARASAPCGRAIDADTELVPTFLALALHYMHYNFVRIHKTLRCTSAVAAGVDARLWSMADVAS